MSGTGERDDPYLAFHFLVNIDGMRAGFSEVGGLSSEQDVVEYREGNHEPTARKLRGLTKYTNLSLKRGYTADKGLWEWRKKAMDGKPERLSGTITLFDENNHAALAWQFYEGWPCKWAGPALNAKNNEVAIEELEICIERLELKS